MDRSPEVEQLALAWLAGMKAGDAAVARLFAEHEATPRSSATERTSGSPGTRTPEDGWTKAWASTAVSPSSPAR